MAKTRDKYVYIGEATRPSGQALANVDQIVTYLYACLFCGAVVAFRKDHDKKDCRK